MYGNFILEESNTPGTGDIILAGTRAGFASFASQFSDGDRVYYSIEDSNGSIELGLGTFTAPSSLKRTQVLATIIGGVYSDAPSGTIDIIAPSVIASSESKRTLNWVNDIQFNLSANEGQIVGIDSSGSGGLLDAVDCGTF